MEVPSVSINSDVETNKKNLENIIKGTTLDVYYYLLRKRASAGVREIQRALELSSPSVASYHLDKLINLNVVKQNKLGNYEIAEKIDIGALHQFVIIGNYTLPRLIFYAIFLTVLFVGYVLFFFTLPLTTAKVFVFIFSVSSILFFWIETTLCWKQRPF